MLKPNTSDNGTKLADAKVDLSSKVNALQVDIRLRSYEARSKLTGYAVLVA